MPTCFVAIPFDGSTTGLYERLYTEEILPALNRAGFSPRIASDSFVARPIFDEIREAINESEILFADVSTKNPNVFAEIGIALGMGKPVAFAFDHDIMERPPFDIQHFRGIPYRRTSRTYLDKFQKDIERTLVETLTFFVHRQAKQEFERPTNEAENRIRTIKMLTLDNLFEPLDPKDGVVERAVVDYLIGLTAYGFRKPEITSAVQTLVRNGWIERTTVPVEFEVYERLLMLTDKAIDWILKRPKFHDDVRKLLAK